MLTFPIQIEKISQKEKNQIFRTILRILRKTIKHPKKLNIFFRRVESASLPLSKYSEITHCPDIEILISVAEKDLVLLKEVINGAIYSSYNEITSINLITPNPDLINKKMYFEYIDKIKIYSDEQILSKDLIQEIDQICGSRSGWIKQQLLVNYYVSNFGCKPILNVDCDTVLTHKRVWIDQNQSQILTPTWEYNEGYYKFLKDLNNKLYKKVNFTFVPHHMLLIPDRMREINFENELNDLNILSILKNGIATVGINYLDFKYEYYAQACIAKKYNVRLEKWSNLSLSRGKLGGLVNENYHLMKFQDWARKNDYASVSFHDWKV